MKKVIVLLLALAVAACVTPPTKEQLANVNYGPRPKDARSTAEKWVKAGLKDPYSARFEKIVFKRGWIKTAPLLGNRFYPGWVYCGTVNAKNSFGAYVGSRVFVIVINPDYSRHSVKEVVSVD